MATSGETDRTASRGSNAKSTQMPNPATMDSATAPQVTPNATVNGRKSASTRGSPSCTTTPSAAPPAAPIAPKAMACAR